MSNRLFPTVTRAEFRKDPTYWAKTHYAFTVVEVSDGE